MIIVDTNVIAYLFLPTPHSTDAEQLLIQEPVWGTPSLWRSELRNILALYLRKELLALRQALQIQAEAELLMAENEFEVSSTDVLALVEESSCSAYDCEFVCLAQNTNTTLVTMDKKILADFPSSAKSLRQFLESTI